MNSIDRNRPLIQVVDGPAGTGKTRVLIDLALRLIYCAERKNLRILLCAANNVALDVITMALVEVIDKFKVDSIEKPTLVRFGKGTAIKNELKAVTVDFHTRDAQKVKALKRANIICTTLPGSSLLFG